MNRPLLIAQNLNASDPAVRGALAAGDGSWLRQCARRIENTGVDFIDCNAGTFGADEAQILAWMANQVGSLVRIPLSIDSADVAVLEYVCARVPGPSLLNSLPRDFEWTEGLRRLLADPARRVVLSLRGRTGLPADATTRLDWARDGLARLEEAGVDPARVFVDAIALPFGDDVEAGRPVLDFIETWASSGSPALTLVGLGNIGYGHPDAVRIHRDWLGRLRDVGIGAALVDAFEPGLRAVLSPGR